MKHPIDVDIVLRISRSLLNVTLFVLRFQCHSDFNDMILFVIQGGREMLILFFPGFS